MNWDAGVLRFWPTEPGCLIHASSDPQWCVTKQCGLVKKKVNFGKWQGLLVVLIWPISSFEIPHWLKRSRQSFRQEAVLL